MGTDQQIEEQRRELARSLDYLTSAELRMLAGITEKTEEAWRKRHIGPAYVVVLNPADWLVVTTATGTDGHYLGGSYLGTMPMEMRGLRVSLSTSVDAGKALLIDTRRAADRRRLQHRGCLRRQRLHEEPGHDARRDARDPDLHDHRRGAPDHAEGRVLISDGSARASRAIARCRPCRGRDC